MFSFKEMPQTTSQFFSAYASFAGSMMLIRSMAHELIPQQIIDYFYKILNYFFTPTSQDLTLVVDESCGMSRNEVYDSAEMYLRSKISPKNERLKVSKTQKQKNFTLAIEKGEEIIDFFENFKLKWRYNCNEPENNNYGGEKRFYELTFHKKYKDKVISDYLPYVLKKATELRDQEKVIRLYNRDCPYDDDDGGGYGTWGSIILEHPSTFDTIALDPEIKNMIKDDLDRFLKRKEFYKRVGRAWKRGYLLYGPPGTGKSSLIAAMANYLKFNIYDLELTSIWCNSELRRILLSTTNRSILVIEDIDCSAQVHDREEGNDVGSNQKLTLSGILNFIDGLWSSVGDERIIIFTTNHKDRLDPALLRPGRMDVHINMSYITVNGFKFLASNYLGDSCKNHSLYGEIEGLIQTTNVTPAEVAEELMKSEDIDVALGGVVNLLKRKRTEADKKKKEEEEKEREKEKQQKSDDEKSKMLRTDDEKKSARKSRRNKRKNKHNDSE